MSASTSTPRPCMPPEVRALIVRQLAAALAKAYLSRKVTT